MYYAGFLLYAGFFGGLCRIGAGCQAGFSAAFFACRLFLSVSEGLGREPCGWNWTSRRDAGEGGDGIGAKIAVGLRMLPKR